MKYKKPSKRDAQQELKNNQKAYINNAIENSYYHKISSVVEDSMIWYLNNYEHLLANGKTMQDIEASMMGRLSDIDIKSIRDLVDSYKGNLTELSANVFIKYCVTIDPLTKNMRFNTYPNQLLFLLIFLHKYHLFDLTFNNHFIYHLCEVIYTLDNIVMENRYLEYNEEKRLASCYSMYLFLFKDVKTYLDDLIKNRVNENN